MFADNAVDVALCVDAATGRTLWRKEIPGGRYWAMNGRQGSGKGFYTTNLAAADGRVYFGTSGDVDYCVEADTGETVWERKLGPTAGRIVVDGVLLRAGDDLVGYDAGTGETLWTVEGAGARFGLPLRWEHDGRAYVLTGNTGGEVRCVDPRDGRVLWTEENAGYNALTMSVHGDHLLCNGRKEEKGPGELTCYRIGPEGAEHAWTIAGNEINYRPQAAPAAAANGYAFIRAKRENGLVVVEIASGDIVARLPYRLGASGYAQWTDDRLMLQVDASHGPTPLLWFDVSDPQRARRRGDVWPTRHATTASYYPILISHAIADGRVIIRGARGLLCYDLRKPQ
jgi:outer membrane protein assembly factor BamB